jgi:hypothetical protein
MPTANKFSVNCALFEYVFLSFELHVFVIARLATDQTTASLGKWFVLHCEGSKAPGGVKIRIFRARLSELLPSVRDVVLHQELVGRKQQNGICRFAMLVQTQPPSENTAQPLPANGMGKITSFYRRETAVCTENLIGSPPMRESAN